jgi:hypothetical protein
MTRTQVILQMSDHQYEMLLFDIWFNWCLKRAIDDIEFQALISNPAINTWFCNEIEFHESQFINRITPMFGSASKGEIIKCYRTTVERIYNHWPKPVIDRVRKQVHKIDTSPLTNNMN